MTNLMRASLTALTAFLLVVVTAVAAHAVTYRSYNTNLQNGWCVQTTYVDYNAWEESWWGGSHRDYSWQSMRWQCRPFTLA